VTFSFFRIMSIDWFLRAEHVVCGVGRRFFLGKNRFASDWRWFAGERTHGRLVRGVLSIDALLRVLRDPAQQLIGA